MASTIKVTNINTPDGTGNIIVDRPLSGSGASLTNLPAANLTGTLPAISGANLTNLPGGGLTATIATMTGDASDTTLALGATPTGEANVTVHIDGVYQNHDQFSVSGAVLTFTVAPPTGSLVESQTWA